MVGPPPLAQLAAHCLVVKVKSSNQLALEPTSATNNVQTGSLWPAQILFKPTHIYEGKPERLFRLLSMIKYCGKIKYRAPGFLVDLAIKTNFDGLLTFNDLEKTSTKDQRFGIMLVSPFQ